jgi:hypothetical protein
VALDRLSVDEPALRAKAALDTQPSAADIEATRANMLNKLLQTSIHPFALIQAHASPKQTAMYCWPWNSLFTASHAA